MKYNDYIMLNDRDYAVMKQSYDRVHANELNDLNEILGKMKEQKKNLEDNNADSRYDRIIEKISENISELENMITTSKQNFAYTAKAPEIPSIPSFLKSITTRKLDLNDPNGAISPVRGTDEMNNHASNSNNLDNNLNNNINYDLDRNTNNSIDYSLNNNNTLEPYESNTDERIDYNFRQPSPAVDNSANGSNRTNTTKRNSPMQGNIISNFVKQINLSFKKSSKQSQNQLINDDQYRMRFHNTRMLSHENCLPRNKLFTGQIDIIRLLLLYMILRPNNRHISRLASIANDQFELLLQLEK